MPNHANSYYLCRVKCEAIPCTKLEEVESQAENFDVIGIDEGQFVNIFTFLFVTHIILI